MKKHKQLVIINLFIIISFILTPILIIIILYYFLFPDGYFFEDKYFKAIHMQKTQKNQDTDIIFIGSSRTQNHISTQQFKKYGHNIYTYGRPSMMLSDFPFPIEKSSSIKPKYIFLMLEINDLFTPIHMKFPTYEDRIFYNKNFSYTTGNEYLLDKYRLKDLFRTSLNFIQNTYLKLHDKYLNSYDKKITNLLDCEIIDWRGVIAKRSVALCSNGNGIVFNNTKLLIENSTKKYNIKNIYDEKIELLNKLIVNIKIKNIIPIIVFEPTEYNVYSDYKHEDYRKIIDAQIIFLSNFEIDKQSLWVDKAHFNIYGREKYTKKLIEEFETILK